MNFFSRSSLATGPKIRVPVGVWSSLMITDNNCLYDITFFDNAAGCCFFNSCDDDIADSRISSCGAAADADAEDFLCTGIISDSESAFLLNHSLIPFLRSGDRPWCSAPPAKRPGADPGMTCIASRR